MFGMTTDRLSQPNRQPMPKAYKVPEDDKPKPLANFRNAKKKPHIMYKSGISIYQSI
jgi:hypothetical protein